MTVIIFGKTLMLTAWTAIGFFGQALFSMRFLIQWIVSERARESLIPKAFWYFSIAGGITLFAYALHREDPVFIAGQGMGLIVYSRNLYLIHTKGKQKADTVPDPDKEA